MGDFTLYAVYATDDDTNEPRQLISGLSFTLRKDAEACINEALAATNFIALRELIYDADLESGKPVSYAPIHAHRERFRRRFHHYPITEGTPIYTIIELPCLDVWIKESWE